MPEVNDVCLDVVNSGILWLCVRGMVTCIDVDECDGWVLQRDLKGLDQRKLHSLGTRDMLSGCVYVCGEAVQVTLRF